MKIVQIKTIIDTGTFSSSPEYKELEINVMQAIKSIVYPDNSNIFTINATPKGNGVVPIKSLFVNTLDSLGWQNEKIADKAIRNYRIDTTKLLSDNLYFGVEWETGNISSSHRAINRLLLGMKSGVLSGGFLVLPSRDLYQYLTDRVGNFNELANYFELWEHYANLLNNNVLKIIEIEHDAISNSVPLIKKGTDGRALR